VIARLESIHRRKREYRAARCRIRRYAHSFRKLWIGLATTSISVRRLNSLGHNHRSASSSAMPRKHYATRRDAQLPLDMEAP